MYSFVFFRDTYHGSVFDQSNIMAFRLNLRLVHGTKHRENNTILNNKQKIYVFVFQSKK